MLKNTVPVAPFMSRPSCSKCGRDRVDCRFDATVDALILTCEVCGHTSACEPRSAVREKVSTRSVVLPEVEADDDQGRDESESEA